MEYKEYRAKTVHDAVTEALIDMQVTSDAIEYEVIEEGSTGLLGLFSKEAVIRARRKDTDDLDAQIHEITNFRSGLKSSVAEPVKKANNNKIEAKPAEKAAEKASEAAGKAAAATEKAAAKAQGTAEKATEKAAVKASDAAEKPAAKAGGNNGPAKKNNANNNAPKAAAAPAAEPSAPKNPPAPYKNEKIEEMLKVIFEKLEIDADITATIDKDEKVITIEAKGSNTGDIIGKRGQTLDAIQYLVSIIVNKDQNEYYRVKLDTNNYRERRQKTLENLAKNVAAKVKKTHKKVALEPMNPYERRVIHSYLQADKYVTTKSEGEEPNRRVVVYYKKS